MKKPLPRRTFLKAGAATLALPTLDAMMPVGLRAESKSKSPARMVLLHRGLGRAAEIAQVVESRVRVSVGADLRCGKLRVARRHANDDIDPTAAQSVTEQLDRDLQRGHGVQGVSSRRRPRAGLRRVQSRLRELQKRLVMTHVGRVFSGRRAVPEHARQGPDLIHRAL